MSRAALGQTPTSRRTVPASSASSAGHNVQRTVAVIHSETDEDSFDQAFRIAVESRIIQAGFDILDENLMEGPIKGTQALASGVNLVYLLERSRALQVWRDLIGEEEAEQGSHSLSALYGYERFWSARSPTESLEAISILFPTEAHFETVTSPSTTGLESPPSTAHAHLSPSTAKRVFSFVNSLPETKPEYAVPSTTRSGAGHSRKMNGSGGEESGSNLTDGTSAADQSDVATDDGVMNVEGVLSGLRIDTTGGEEGQEELEVEEGTEVEYVYEVDPSTFRARGIPATHATPSIQPRLSRAALLRMGIQPPPIAKRERSTASGERDLVTPGVHQRPVAILPKSLSQPTIAPRQTKASMLRTGAETGAGSPGPRPSATRRPSSDTSKRASMFLDTPGHKRSESIQVASTAPPRMAPRPTRASALRASTGGPGSTGSPSPTVSRSTSRSSLSGPGIRTPSRTGSSIPRTPGSEAIYEGEAEGEEEMEVVRGAMNPFENTPGHRRIGIVKVASVSSGPSIAPRPNRAAMLRAMKNPVKETGPKPIRNWQAQSVRAASAQGNR